MLLERHKASNDSHSDLSTVFPVCSRDTHSHLHFPLLIFIEFQRNEEKPKQIEIKFNENSCLII